MRRLEDLFAGVLLAVIVLCYLISCLAI